MSEQRRPHSPGRRGPGFGMPVVKAKDFKRTLKTLIAYLSVYRLGITVVVIFAIGSTIFSIIGPKIMGDATTEIFEGIMRQSAGGEGIDFVTIQNIILTMAILYVISATFSYIQGFIMAGISQKVTYNLRNSISKKITKMPMDYFDKKTHGEVLSRITNDIDTLGQSLNQSMTQIIASVCSDRKSTRLNSSH